MIREVFTTSGSWICPAGITKITVECWGGGGAGSDGYSTTAAGCGGGGGAYAKKICSVIPGNTYFFTVGIGGRYNAIVSGLREAGGDSQFNSNEVLAKGGGGGKSLIDKGEYNDKATYVNTTTECDWVTYNGSSYYAKQETTGNLPTNTTYWGVLAQKGTDGTDISNQVLSIESSATPEINTDNYNFVSITALATDITSMTSGLTGTPNNFDKLIFRIKDDGTTRNITWGDSFEAKGTALPTATTAGKVLTVGFIYDSITSKWGCIASLTEE